MTTKKLLLNVLMASLLSMGSMAYAGKYTADVAAAEAAYRNAVQAMSQAEGRKAKDKAQDVKDAALLSLNRIKNKDIKARLAEGESVNSILTSSYDKDLAFHLIMLNTPKNELLNLLTTVTRDFPTMAYQAIANVMTYAPTLSTQIIANAITQGLSSTDLNTIKTTVDGYATSNVGGWYIQYLSTNTSVNTFLGGSGGAACRILASCN